MLTKFFTISGFRYFPEFGIISPTPLKNYTNIITALYCTNFVKKSVRAYKIYNFAEFKYFIFFSKNALYTFLRYNKQQKTYAYENL